MPSPQTSVQIDGEVVLPAEQLYPGLLPIQVELHPPKLLSSQTSPKATFPSLQIKEHFE